MSLKKIPEWWVYLVRCADETLYCGIAIDPCKRENDHNNSSKGAAYTRARRPVHIVWKEKANSRSEALKREIQIKKMTKTEKEILIKSQVEWIAAQSTSTSDEPLEVTVLYDTLELMKELGEKPILWKVTPQILKALSTSLHQTEDETSLGIFLDIPIDLCSSSPGIVTESTFCLLIKEPTVDIDDSPK
jgi:putative endonuclease